MENENNISRAYKLHFDVSRLNFGKFEQNIPALGSVILFDDEFYIWLDPEYTIGELKKALKRLKVGDFYCEPISFPESTIQDKGFVNNHLTAWYAEHYRESQLYNFNKNNQDLLQKAHENILRAIEEIKTKEAESIGNRE